MNVNRRSMLLGLAAASTAAAGTEAISTPLENPKLIELAEQLPAISAAFHEVNDRYNAAYKQWDSKTPWAPDELTKLGTGWPYDVPNQPGEAEMRILGGFLWRVGDEFPRRIVVKGWHLSAPIREARRKKRRAKKDGSLADFMAAETDIKRLKKLQDVALSYEQEFRALRDEALDWHKSAYPEKDDRLRALERHVAAIMREEDRTMEGLVIKAQALAEWDRVGPRRGDKLAVEYGKDWYGQIAASILRHAQVAAS